MALPGTKLARKVLKKTGLNDKCYRMYTYVRANDRSYKIYGFFTEKEANKLVRKLTKRGALSARIVPNHYGGCGGVRFELEA